MATPHRSKRRHLAWLPAVLLISAGIVTSLGVSLIPSATATTSTDNVDITATVLTEVSVTACANPTSFAMATGLADTAMSQCAVTFGSNNASVLATLTVKDGNAGDATFFCERASANVACSGDGVLADSVANVADMADGSFGARRNGAASNCTAAGWVGAGTTTWYPVTEAGTMICTDTASGAPLGSVTVEWGVDTTATQAPGTYWGRAVMEVTAS